MRQTCDLMICVLNWCKEFWLCDSAFAVQQDVEIQERTNWLLLNGKRLALETKGRGRVEKRKYERKSASESRRGLAIDAKDLTVFGSWHESRDGVWQLTWKPWRWLASNMKEWGNVSLLFENKNVEINATYPLNLLGCILAHTRLHVETTCLFLRSRNWVPLCWKQICQPKGLIF